MLTIAGKKLEESSKSPPRVEGYFKSLDKLAKSDAIAPRIRFLIRDVLDLRRMKWVPRRETLKVRDKAQPAPEAGTYCPLLSGCFFTAMYPVVADLNVTNIVDLQEATGSTCLCPILHCCAAQRLP